MPSRLSRRSTRSNDADEVALSARIDLSQPEDVRFMRAVLPHSKHNANLPWQWYDTLGDVVHQGVARGARTAGYAKLGAYKVEKDGSIGKKIESGLEAAIAARIQSPYGGQRALMERFFTLSKVPGDSYLIRCREGDDIIGYDVLDAAEIDFAGAEGGTGRTDGAEVFSPGQAIRRITHPKIATGEKLSINIDAADFIARIWRPTARYVDVADSPMRALEDTCEQLWLLTRSLRSKLLSRLALNGLLYIPSEINEIKNGAPTGEANKVTGNEVIDKLIKAATWAVQNPGLPESSLPIFLSGPGINGEQIRFIQADRELYEVDMRLRRELIDRILMGLDVVPEGVKGNSETNHWGAWVNADDDLKVNVKPEIETFCWAATRCILHEEMQRAKIAPGRIAKTVIWYDISQANVKTNLAEDARQGYDRVLVGPKGARRMTGIPESEAPTDIEAIRIYGLTKGDPYLATYGMAEQKNIDWDKVGKTKSGPGADSNGDKPESSPSAPAGGPGDSKSDTPRKDRPS